MARVDTSEIDDVQEDLKDLWDNVPSDVEDKVEEEVDNLLEAIITEIEKKGLRGDPSDKPDQPPLAASFQANRAGGSEWIIYSTAEHAMPLEQGADPHRIEPKNVDLLSWVPENPADYPTIDEIEVFPQTWYDPDDGVVYSTGVTHPGNRAYKYVLDAQSSWAAIAKIRIDQTVREAIIRSGFKPSVRGVV